MPLIGINRVVKVYSPLYAVLFAILGAILGAIVFYILGMGLGVITGVVAMCSTAPFWLIGIFLLAFVFGFFASAFYSGRWAYWRYRKLCNV